MVLFGHVSSEGPPAFTYIPRETISKLGEIKAIEKSPRDTGDDWVISIKGKLEQAQRDDDMTSWGTLCIYRIPQYLHQKHSNSYLPETVSIGPYHHGAPHLLPMECHKWRAVNKILKRTESSIEMYFDGMREIESKARACYQGPIPLSSAQFTEMLVIDSCFSLEIFRGCIEGFEEIGYDHNDPVFARRVLMHSIQRDMIMLENQLPLLVLNRLLQLQYITVDITGMVAKLAVRFFNPLMPTDQPSTEMEHLVVQNRSFNPIADKDMGELHCLDVFRRSLLQSSTETTLMFVRRRWYWGSTVVDKRQQEMIYCATELRDAGIKFKRRETDQFWDIHFKNGSLEIPRLFIHDGTKSLFLNLIAFEQCHNRSTNDITSYIVFMDNLINSREDVSHLRSCGIIVHWLESDSEVADMFNRLGQDLVFNVSDSYLYELSIEANRYYLHHNKYYRKWNSWKSTLKEKYFDSPWAYISFFAAFILLLLTLSQSYFAAYAYYKPPS